MEQDYRFTWQENQYWGSCEPCTASVFRAQVESKAVAWKIGMRQAIDKAVEEGLPLDEFTRLSDFQHWRVKQESRPRAGEKFAALSTAEKLAQWAQTLKSSLPCFIFAVREFAAIPKTDKQGHEVTDGEGKQVLMRRRLQSSIRQLSALFMFDADHLPCDPREIYERTLRQGFPWQVRLAHKTSSGHGLRLVCEAMPEIGNIADNQIELGRELGLLGMVGTTGKAVCDDSCIDASRISYAPRLSDIYYIDENKLFNFLK